MFDLLAVFAVALRQRGGARLQFAIGLGAPDGDHRLLGEGLQQRHLAVGEAARIFGVERDNADRVAVAQQRQ